MRKNKYADCPIDIIVMPDGDSLILDRDELDEALQLQNVSEQEYALAVAETEHLMEELAAKRLHMITDYLTYDREAL